MATSTTSATSGRLKAREVAMLQRALDTERAAARAAQERAQEMQQALDSERSAVRALRREVAGQVRAAREQEAKKCAALLDQMRTRMELTQAEMVGAEREQLTRTLTAQFQRELQGREEAWRRETRRLQEGLQEQLRQAQRSSLEREARGDVEALVHSLHAEFQRDLHQKQDQWKRESKAQVDALTNQLRELQRLYTETCNQLTIITNEAETIPKLKQDNQTLKLQNKDLEEKIQMLTEADKRKVEQFRTQYEENNARIAELQRSARKETFQLLEELKSKERLVAQLQREYHRHSVSPRAGSRSSVAASGSSRPSNTPDRESPGEPPRMQCIKRPKNLAFASDLNKRLRAQEGRKPPDPPEPDPSNAKKEVQESSEQLKDRLSEPIKNSNEGGIAAEVINNNWTKTVGVETLYKLLLNEHQELQKAHHQAVTRLREEEKLRLQLEEQLRECRRTEGDNTINLALAEQIQALQERQVELESEAQELREQNDLLEFRILELDDVCSHSCASFHFKSPSSRSPDTRERESDDISDSGVMSLPTSEDISEADYQDYKMEPNNRDVKSKLAQLCQSLESVSDRISVQQGLALLRHYETRLENLEATLAAMCQEATQTKSYDLPPSTNSEKSPSRIIATVLPFTDLSSTYPGKELREELPLKKLLREQDCMQESGIFEESGLPSCLLNIATQTDWTIEAPPGDLGAEIRKLTQIRERMEEQGGNRKLLKSPEVDQKFLTATSIKELIYYRDRVQILEDKLTIYESKGDDQSKLLAKRLEKEVLLAAQLKHLQRTVKLLKEENRLLDEERCEFEEAENDTRLRCQKLEVKLSALGEKKSDLQVQLQQNARTMSNLRSSLSEEERKRNEARQYAAKMEAFANRLEQQNFEMEEREMEVRYRLHTLENVVPAMVMFYLWRMLNAVRPLMNEKKHLIVRHSVSDSILAITPSTQSLENRKKLSKHKNNDSTRENLRRQVDEAYNFLHSEPIRGSASQSDTDEAFQLIEMLTRRCHEMEERIKELEYKERNYQKFVQNGDEQLVNLELEFKHQIKFLEEELLQKQFKVDSVQNQLKKQTQNQETEQQYYMEQINQMENEIARLKDALNQKEKDRKGQEGEVKRLNRELEEALDNMEQWKTTVEKPLRDELESKKKKVKDLLGDKDILEQEKEENQELQNKVVNELKRINDRACRDLEESEVTISELKEEVMTLEFEVQSLRRTLSKEREASEFQLLQAGEELEVLRSLGSLGSGSQCGSLHEELMDAAVESRTVECPVDNVSTADTSVSKLPPVLHSYHSLNECQKAEQAIKDFDPSDLTMNSLDQVSTAYQHSRVCRNCKNTTAVELRGILNLLQKTAPQSKMVQTSPSLLHLSSSEKVPDQLSSSSEVTTKAANKGERARGSSQEWHVSSFNNKLRVKDHMIRCLADALRTSPHDAEELSTRLALDPPHTFDFSRSSLLEYISDKLTPRITGLNEGEYDPGYSSVNPLLLRVTRQDSETLCVKWTSPSSNLVTGFQISVEGQMTDRIYSAARNSKLFHPVDLEKPVTVTIQALNNESEVVQEHSIRYSPSSSSTPQ